MVNAEETEFETNKALRPIRAPVIVNNNRRQFDQFQFTP
jgi:hypothetical protein